MGVYFNMSKGKSTIPDFMSNNPNDTFKFLFPLKLILDENKFGNSHYYLYFIIYTISILVISNDKKYCFCYNINNR